MDPLSGWISRRQKSQPEQSALSLLKARSNIHKEYSQGLPLSANDRAFSTKTGDDTCHCIKFILPIIVFDSAGIDVHSLSDSVPLRLWDWCIVYWASNQAPRSISLHLSEQKGKYRFGICLSGSPVCLSAGVLQIGHLDFIFDAHNSRAVSRTSQCPASNLCKPQRPVNHTCSTGDREAIVYRRRSVISPYLHHPALHTVCGCRRSARRVPHLPGLGSTFSHLR